MRLTWRTKLPLSLALTLVGFVAAAELALRRWPPHGIALGRERLSGTPGDRIVQIEPGNPVHPKKGHFELDPELGYRPIPGGPEYGPHGALWNDHPLEKRPGVRRLLFLGDSVTRRGKIVDALCELFGAEVECWNAGVVGYSTRQEFDYYRRECADLAADHVVLTFHLNDYETTPVTFLEGDRMVAVYGQRGSRNPNAWLYQHSYLYRFYWTRSARATSAELEQSLAREIEDALRGLQSLTAERSARFTVLLFPWASPPGQWSESMSGQLVATRRLLETLGIDHYDLVETLEGALAAGIDVQEEPGDLQHPSAEFGRWIARDLVERGFRP